MSERRVGGVQPAATAPGRGFEVLLPGISVPFGDGRYLRRFVVVAGVAVETAAVRSQVNAGGVTETVLENPSPIGVLQSQIPANALPAGFLENGDGARIGTRLKIARVGNTPVLAGIRAAGTYAAPTPPLLNDTLFQINARPITDTGGAGTAAVTASIVFRARENLGAAAYGTQVEISTGRVGAATTDIPAIFRGAAGLSEWLFNLATGRLVPATTGQLRNPANTSSLVEWNATGLGFFNVAPIARPTITGSRGGNAALASLLTQGALLGLWIDTTTA